MVQVDGKTGDTGKDRSDDDLSISWLNSTNSKISSQSTLKSFDGARVRACVCLNSFLIHTINYNFSFHDDTSHFVIQTHQLIRLKTCWH